MSVEQLTYDGQAAGDPNAGLLERLRAMRQEVPIVEDEVALHAFSASWPLWHRFLADTGKAASYTPPTASPQGRTAEEVALTAENTALRAEAASVLLHMASGAFWDKKAELEMNPADLTNAMTMAASFVTRLGLTEPEPAPGDHDAHNDDQPTEVINPWAFYYRDDERTQVVGRETFFHGSAADDLEQTQVIPLGVGYRGDEPTAVHSGMPARPHHDYGDSQATQVIPAPPDHSGFNDERFGLANDPTRPINSDPEITQPLPTDPSGSENTVVITAGWRLEWPATALPAARAYNVSK
ncbi:MAG TPA: hypothetical protein VLF71_06235 [Candidatus Saccharimonadales bacterium]|nr:hypothetical protein [Candidatus Saccharimonadales bacterium]